MSYILEALKKAQAERQIGSAPTIHAPTLASASAGQGSAGRRTPLIVAMVLMGAAIAGLATMLVRQQQPASPVPAAGPAQQLAAAPASTAPPPPGAAQPTAPASASTASPPPGAAQPTAPDPASTASPPPGVAQPTALTSASTVSPPLGAAQPTAPTSASTASPPPGVAEPGAPRLAAATRQGEPSQRGANAAPAMPTPAQPAPALRPPQAQAPSPAPAPAPAPIEEHVQSLHELPEPIQRAIPPIALGGYMYSKNPADRLLLIDKVLRREGEEVAPGLVLDKLLPKQAIFSFRGYRYRVPL